MNFDMKKLSRDEVEIDIKSLIKRCLEQLKFIIIIGIVCAILLPLVMYAKDLSNMYEQNEDLQIGEGELSKEEMLEVDEYILLAEKQQELEDFLENSALMDMDYTNVFKTRMQLYFKGENGYDIACAVRNYVLNSAVEYEINKNLKKGEKRVSTEMISVSIYEGSGVLNIELLAKDEQTAQKYIEIFNSQIEKYCESLQEGIGSHSLDIIQLQVECVSVENVYDWQKQYLQDYKNISSSVESLKGGLNEQQKMQIAVALDDSEFEDIEKVEVVQPGIEFKYAILGLVIGVVLGLGLIILVVLFGGKVQSEHEIQKRLQISYLGLAGKEKNQMIIAKLNTMSSQRNINDIKFISSSDFTKDEKMKEIMIGLKENNISCSVIDKILVNESAMQNLSEESNVVMVEIIGKTKVEDLYQEALLCKELNTNIIGYLMV